MITLKRGGTGVHAFRVIRGKRHEDPLSAVSYQHSDTQAALMSA